MLWIQPGLPKFGQVHADCGSIMGINKFVQIKLDGTDGNYKKLIRRIVGVIGAFTVKENSCYSCHKTFWAEVITVPH